MDQSLGKSGRFRTSGSDFWSRITGSRFGSVSYGSYNNGTPMEHTKFIEIPVVLLIFWNIQWTINCKVATRVRERSRFLKTPHVLEHHNCDTYTRTEPILQNTTRSGTSQLWHVYENGADSSNLKISWIHETLIFEWRDEPWDAMSFPCPQGNHCNYKRFLHENTFEDCGRWTRGTPARNTFL